MTRFCRVLRGRGLLVGADETSDAVRALTLVDVLDRGRVYWTLRTVLLSRHEELGLFDELFERFWSFEPHRDDGQAPTAGPSAAGEIGRLRRVSGTASLVEDDAAARDTLVEVVRTGASAAEVVSEKDLTGLRSEELAELSRIAARMVRALAARPGRRRKRHRRKGTPDLRGALRLSLATGGEPVRLPGLRRVLRLPRLLVLLDVSGSMDRHAQLLLQLVYAVAQRAGRVEALVFSTALTRVTRQLRAPSFYEALRRIGGAVDHWSGGTRIGESIARVNSHYSSLEDRYTTVLLLSDGWDTGDPAHLARELRRMRRRVRSIVWLNPLLGTKDYRPATRGLKAAMPYVDHFASATDIDHLKRLPQLLRA